MVVHVPKRKKRKPRHIIKRIHKISEETGRWLEANSSYAHPRKRAPPAPPKIVNNYNDVNHRLQPDHRLAAAIAHCTYKTDEERRTTNHLTDHGWNYYDNPSNNSEMGVWRNEKENHFFIGLKGTKPSHIGDLAADAAIATGHEMGSSRFDKVTEDAYQFMKRERKKDPKAKFSMSGHSLGGRLVNASMSNPVMMTMMENAYAFAPGANPLLNTQTGNLIQGNIDQGYDYTHLHQHLTGPMDVLSSNASHNEPGNVYHHHTSTHGNWDDWLDPNYWESYNQDTQPLSVANFFTGGGEVDKIEAEVIGSGAT